MSSLHIQGLTKRFGGVAAAIEVSFDLESGGAIALLGPPGCGKTTILRCIAGLETPDWGIIEIDGKPVFDSTKSVDLPSEDRALGVVFRSHAVWPHMTIADNVAFPLKVRGVPKAERLARAAAMLELVGLKGFEDRSATLVSTSQRQRIAIARALVHNPGLVLFDEPLAALDPVSRPLMRAELRQLRERLGFTAIYLTRDHGEAFGLADRVILLNNGAIDTIGTPQQVYHLPRTSFAARFFGMNILEGRLLGPVANSNYLEVELSARLVIRGVAAPDIEFPEGGRVLACIRKDSVRVFRPRPGEAPQGAIVASSFVGAAEEYLVDIAGVRIEATGPAVGLTKGDQVVVRMTPDEWVFVR